MNRMFSFIIVKCSNWITSISFADADDVDAWMFDIFRIVSSEDVGKDEASVQSLLKKHKVRSKSFIVNARSTFSEMYLRYQRPTYFCICLCRKLQMNLRTMKVPWLLFMNKLPTWENRTENLLTYRTDWEALTTVTRNYWNWPNSANRGCWMPCPSTNSSTRLMVLKHG